MHRRVFTHIITLLCIAAFLVPRVANLHALSHLSDDGAVSCELCDIIVDTPQFDLINDTNSYLESEQQSIPSSFVIVLQYNTPQEKIVSPTCIYNKPPPFV